MNSKIQATTCEFVPHRESFVPQLSSEYGVEKSTILNWVRNLSPIQVSETEIISRKEYKTLQKKMEELEIENEI